MQLAQLVKRKYVNPEDLSSNLQYSNFFYLCVNFLSNEIKTNDENKTIIITNFFFLNIMKVEFFCLKFIKLHPIKDRKSSHASQVSHDYHLIN